MGEKPGKTNTSHVKQLKRHEKDPLSDKVVGSELDNDNLDVIILT